MRIQANWLIVMILTLFLCSWNGNAAGVSPEELEYEERILINMLDKGNKRGYEAYQTPFLLYHMAQLFFGAGKYDIALAEAEKIEDRFSTDTKTMTDVFRLRTKDLLRQGKVQEALSLLETYKDDPRKKPYGTKGRLYLGLCKIAFENLRMYYLSKEEYAKALEAHRKQMQAYEIEASEVNPSLKERPLWILSVSKKKDLGDIYSWAGRYKEAAECYQQVLNYMNTHKTPPNLPIPKYNRFRETLPQLIDECTTQAESDELFFKRNVDYKYELAVKLRKYHYFQAIDELHKSILEALKDSNRLARLPVTKQEHYREIRSEILSIGNMVVRANVDGMINNAEFNEFFFGKKEKTLQYYQKAKAYLGSHSLPEFLSEESRNKYENLHTKWLPQKIEALKTAIETGESSSVPKESHSHGEEQ